MASGRLEVRLDQEYREKLDEVIRRRGASVSALIREMIDQFYEEAELQERLAAVQRIADSQIEELPDPEELSRQLDERCGRYPDLR